MQDVPSEPLINWEVRARDEQDKRIIASSDAVDVDQFGALAASDEDRVAPDRAHRAHRRVDAAGNDLERAPVELSRASVLERCGQVGRTLAA